MNFIGFYSKNELGALKNAVFIDPDAAPNSKTIVFIGPGGADNSKTSVFVDYAVWNSIGFSRF